MRDYEADKKKVFDWLKTYCYGVENARKRTGILPHIQLPDRYFRAIASELRKEGHIVSSNSFGYFFKRISLNGLPYHIQRAEIDAIKQSYVEQKAKALSTLDKINLLLAQAEDLERQLFQGQKVFCIG